LTVTAPSDGKFGTSVAVFGESVAVGAPDFSSADSTVLSGAVYIYVDNRWDESVVLSPTDLTSDAFFGYNLAMNADTLAVSAIDSHGGGVVYLYKRRAGGWDLAALLSPSASLGVNTLSYFGESIALVPSIASSQSSQRAMPDCSNPCDFSACPATVVVMGAPGDDSISELSGALYLYLLPSVTCSHYGAEQIHSLAMKITCNDSTAFTAYGESVAAGTH
jgi:hypothetical protein